MRLITGVAGVAAVIAIGGIATRAPALAGATTTAATTAPGAVAPATGTSSPAPVSRCDDGDWRGPAGVNVDGRPDNLDAGDRGAVYAWHSADGWRIRTTDVTNTAHHYTGTVALSRDARFTSFAPVRLEHDDRVWVDGNNVLHYDFTTFRGVDGVNFTVSACDGARQHETMLFTMDINGHEDDPSRIDLGDMKQHPPFATFTVTRSV
jgi:hypothetical protein